MFRIHPSNCFCSQVKQTACGSPPYYEVKHNSFNPPKHNYNRQSKQTINKDLLKMVSFLSACKASSRVKGKSNQRARVMFSCMVRPKISKYEGALSIACVPIWIRIPVITIVLLLFVTSMVKPPGCRRQITAQKGEVKSSDPKLRI